MDIGGGIVCDVITVRGFAFNVHLVGESLVTCDGVVYGRYDLKRLVLAGCHGTDVGPGDRLANVLTRWGRRDISQPGWQRVANEDGRQSSAAGIIDPQCEGDAGAGCAGRGVGYLFDRDIG